MNSLGGSSDFPLWVTTADAPGGGTNINKVGGTTIPAGGLPIYGAAFTTEIDYSGGTNAIYVGIAQPGTATSAASWQIKKITYDVNSNPTVVAFAAGTQAFTAIWDNRASLSYS